MLASMHETRLYLQVHLLLFEDPWRHSWCLNTWVIFFKDLITSLPQERKLIANEEVQATHDSSWVFCGKPHSLAHHYTICHTLRDHSTPFVNKISERCYYITKLYIVIPRHPIRKAMGRQKIYTKVFIQNGIQLWQKLELNLADALWTCQSLPKAATGFAHSLTYLWH